LKCTPYFRRANAREISRPYAGGRRTRTDEFIVSGYGELHAFAPVFFSHWKNIFNGLQQLICSKMQS
jgi:hypothetical protein